MLTKFLLMKIRMGNILRQNVIIDI